MFDTIYALAPYAPTVLFVAAALDIFFITGLLLYGAAMLSSVAMLHATGMISAPGIAVSAFLGTLGGNALNFYCGKLFAETAFVQRRLTNPRTQKAQATLETRGLFFYILIGRFITFTRPLYGLLAGSIGISARRFFLYEVCIACFWVVFWLYMILQSEHLLQNLISY